jgi:DNA mismatch endonuclease (patch repair protein)
MQNVRRRDTPGEIALRRALHRGGLRFRLDIQPEPSVKRKADIVFRSAKVAVFCDGCYWHGCPEHGRWPKANAAWWRAKIERTMLRDRDTDAVLGAAGWHVVRVWEHEEVDVAASRITGLVRDRAAR